MINAMARCGATLWPSLLLCILLDAWCIDLTSAPTTTATADATPAGSTAAALTIRNSSLKVRTTTNTSLKLTMTDAAGVVNVPSVTHSDTSLKLTLTNRDGGVVPPVTPEAASIAGPPVASSSGHPASAALQRGNIRIFHVNMSACPVMEALPLGPGGSVHIALRKYSILRSMDITTGNTLLATVSAAIPFYNLQLDLRTAKGALLAKLVNPQAFSGRTATLYDCLGRQIAKIQLSSWASTFNPFVSSLVLVDLDGHGVVTMEHLERDSKDVTGKDVFSGAHAVALKKGSQYMIQFDRESRAWYERIVDWAIVYKQATIVPVNGSTPLPPSLVDLRILSLVAAELLVGTCLGPFWTILPWILCLLLFLCCCCRHCVYRQFTDELARDKMLGSFSTHTPFDFGHKSFAPMHSGNVSTNQGASVTSQLHASANVLTTVYDPAEQRPLVTQNPQEQSLFVTKF